MPISAPTASPSKLMPFALKGTDNRVHALEEIRGENGTLLMFICNHCPYVKAVIGRLVEDVGALQAAGIGAAAIMSNDTETYPADSFNNMQKFAVQHSFPFPYLIDETQEVARAYGAVCTPDLFGFNRDGVLAYRGRVDSAGSKPRTGNEKRELRDAMLLVARTGQGPAEQIPSIGCSIKWRR
ncbi:MAG TPA: thioredoxin family protein [Propylenella sp.]|nr:thioredoxin family protein [Propylenella sp.]